MSYYIRDGNTESKLYLLSKLTEKLPLESVFTNYIIIHENYLYLQTENYLYLQIILLYTRTISFIFSLLRLTIFETGITKVISIVQTNREISTGICIYKVSFS